MPISRRKFVTAGTLATTAATTSGKAAERRRPNILFLMPDQHRYHAEGCLGNTDVKTPHLDRLASEGVILDHVFANTPVCCPARSILLTGQYCHRNGMVANDLRLREGSVSFPQNVARRRLAHRLRR